MTPASPSDVTPSEGRPTPIDRLPIVAWALFLTVLPLYPSQDGPAHLLHGSTLVSWILGDASARALFELQDGLFTNWTAAVVLGDLQVLLGLSPAWAERLWLTLLVAVWVDAFARLRARLGTSHLVPWLVLLLFQGRLAHMGFWNFLVAVGLGLWAWSVDRPALGGGSDGAGTIKRPWRPTVAASVAFLLALVSHPFGALLYLALVATENLLAHGWQSWRRLVYFIPHGLLTLATLGGSVGGAPHWPRPEWPDLLGRELGPWIHHWRPEAWPRVVLIGLLVLWALASWRSGQSSDAAPDRQRRLQRRTLAFLAVGALGLASFGPEALGSGSVIRGRFTFLAWTLILLALPLGALAARTPSRATGMLPRLTAVALAVALVPPTLHSRSVAKAQDELLASLPALDALSPSASDSSGAWVAATWDAESYDRAAEAQGASLGTRDLLYQPFVHLGDRWIAAHHAFNPLSYPMHTGHFPVAAKHRFSTPFLEAVKWRPFRVPWESLAPDLDAFLLLTPPPDVEHGLVARSSDSWTAIHGSIDAPSQVVLFASQSPRPRAERTPQQWPTDALVPPRPVPLDPRLPSRGLALPVGPDYAHWRWRAFLRLEDGRFVPAPESAIQPTAGRFDGRGVVTVERWSAPDPPQLLVLIPG